MLEYILFDERPWRRFIDYLESLGLEPQASSDDQGWLVALPEDLDDELDEKIEAFYDRMLAMNESLVAQEEGQAQVHTAGINLTLAGGQVVQAAVDPKLMQRLLSVITPEELGELVNLIVDAVENPDERPLCQR
jgi:riboflavin biosynthesis pyrimidine reductase